MIAFYPVFGEIVFFYLLYQDLQKDIADREASGELIEETNVFQVSADSAQPTEE